MLMWKEMEVGGGSGAVTPTQRLAINNTSALSEAYTPTKDVLGELVYSGYNGTFYLYEDGTQVWSDTTSTGTDGYKWKWSTYPLKAGKAYTIKMTYQYSDSRFALITLDT